jgi:hypothetical protein
MAPPGAPKVAIKDPGIAGGSPEIAHQSYCQARRFSVRCERLSAHASVIRLLGQTAPAWSRSSVRPRAVGRDECAAGAPLSQAAQSAGNAENAKNAKATWTQGLGGQRPDCQKIAENAEIHGCGRLQCMHPAVKTTAPRYQPISTDFNGQSVLAALAAGSRDGRRRPIPRAADRDRARCAWGRSDRTAAWRPG